jgi:hypothetical protein
MTKEGRWRVGPTNDPDLDPALRRVRGVIERLVREGTALARSDGTVRDLFPVAASAAEGEALREWISRERAIHTIEVGLGYGVSTLYVCEGLLGNASEATAVRHVVIDPHQATRFSDLGLQFLGEAGVAEMVEHHAEGSETALPRPGGIVFLDDYQLPAVARASSFFLTNLGWTPEEVSPPDDLHQWAALRTPAVPDTRPFDHFLDF